jgi:hypothetical protein
MQNIFYVLILLLGIATYVSAVWQMLKGEYSPSLFSRGVWFLLGFNSFATVLLGEGSDSSVLLAGTAFIGTGILFALSYKKGSRDFGWAEKISLGLLIISLVVWVSLDAPFIGLIMTLVAHFIGGIPTIWRAVKKASSEQAYHWYFFFVASILSFISSPDKSLTAVLFPVYFILFEGLILLLVNRRRLLRI